jgi:hypothetical protein
MPTRLALYSTLHQTVECEEDEGPLTSEVV